MLSKLASAGFINIRILHGKLYAPRPRTHKRPNNKSVPRSKMLLPSGLKFYKCIANVMIKKHWIGFSSLGAGMVQCSPPDRTRCHVHVCVVLVVVLVFEGKNRDSKIQFTGGARIKQSIGSQTLEITMNLHIDKKAIEHCVVPGNYLYPPQGGVTW